MVISVGKIQCRSIGVLANWPYTYGVFAHGITSKKAAEATSCVQPLLFTGYSLQLLEHCLSEMIISMSRVATMRGA